MTATNDATKIESLHEFTPEERYHWLKTNPTGAEHLFSLLARGKGDGDAFDTMVCRIMRSEFNARAARAGAKT